MHVYKCFDEQNTLESAYRKLKKTETDLPTFLLTETSNDNAFERWSSGNCVWSIEKLKEDHELLLGGKLLIVAGRQVITAEGIEVLATFTNRRFQDGEPLATTLQRVKNAGAVPILPWGVGKWLGNRGRIVSNIVRENPSLLIGDIAGRPKAWPLPSWTRSKRIINGSDPLPLPSQENRGGAYGFSIQPDSLIDFSNPSKQLKNSIENPQNRLHPAGRQVSIWQSLSFQLALRLHKNHGRTS